MQQRPHALLILMLSLTLAGCGDGSRATQASSHAFCSEVLPRVQEFTSRFEEPTGDRYGGMAVVASYGELADGLNGLVSADYSATQHQLYVNLMSLVAYDADLEPQPYLAESWEFSEDGRELTFYLRDDVFWHDGTKTSAYDVEFTYLRATDPETGFPNPNYWAHYVKGPEGVQVVDSFTVTIGLRPHVDALDPWTTTPVMPEHLLGDVPPGELARHPYGTVCPVGNGPFVFVEHRQDESWSFRRNPAFPQGLGGPPYLDRYVYRIVLEQTTLLTDLLTENIDVYISPNPDQAADIVRSEHLDLLTFPFRQYTFVGWNARRPQLSDRRVRAALTLGTNRSEMVQALVRGFGDVANSTVPSFHWAADAALAEEMPYDPDRARSLLDEAGWIDRDGDGVRENEDGEKLSITVKSNQGNEVRADVAQLMQAQLAEIGVEVEPRIVEWTTLLGQVIDAEVRDFDGVVFAWVVDFRIDDTDLFHSGKIDGPYALSGTRNEEIDMLLDTLQLITDRDEARPYWRRYQQAIIEEQPYTFLYFSRRLDGVNRRLQDVTMDVRGEWLSIKDWWIPEDQRKYGTVANR
jgi:peptide/nickel transport system substrate-binding protein